MRILLIKMSPIDGLNSSTLRTLALANGLVKLGHEVHYLTVPISGCHVLNESNGVIKKVNIIRTGHNSIYESLTIKSKNKNLLKSLVIKFLRRVYHKFSIYDYTYKIAKEIQVDILKDKDFDIIISSSDPKTSHIVAKRLVNQGVKHNNWIQYWGDPLANDITNKSIYPKCMLKFFEYNLIKSANKVIYVSPFTYKQQLKDFPGLANRMSWLPIPYIEKKNYNKAVNDVFTIGYYGAYKSNVRNIYPLYNACKKMDENVHLDIIGDSDLRLEDTGNIKIHPRGNVDSFEKNADILVCMLNSSGTQIPGKIYHYAATNKPILVLLDGDNIEEMKEYLESFGRYILCLNDKKDIVTAIKEIKENPKEYYPSELLDPAFIANKFINE